MAKIYDEIDERLRAFIAAQHCFFVASAPSGPGGHVNCSPKGLDTFRVLGSTSAAYIDYTGSGVETVAHVRENGRIVVMFCAFQGPPNIVRLHGRAEVVEPRDPDFAALRAHFEPGPGLRAIVRIAVTRISDSCGYGVPLLDYEGERPQLAAWAERKGDEGLHAYRREKNARSVDSLPALRGTDDAGLD